jgi:geranylgeranyl diphosphate synthase type II
MAKVTVEGQAAELEWVRGNYWNLNNADYYDMCTKKTSWYTAITPCRIGARIGFPDISDSNIKSLTRFSYNLGLAFQIQDDVLNILGEESEYGKEINGDLLEGKRTLIMIILYNSSKTREKRQIRNIFGKKRAEKTRGDIKYIHDLLEKYRCIEKSSNISKDFARKAITVLDNECDWMKNVEMKLFLRDIAAYVVERNK